MYNGVVATLTMIESPTATAFTVEPTASEEADAPLLSVDEKKSAPAEPDLFLVKTKPITSKIRTTIRHLKSEAGKWAPFRGLHVAMVYCALHQILFELLTAAFGVGMVPQAIAAITTTVILCRLQMLWTHIVISTPSEQKWYRRFPSVEAGKKIIVPTTIMAVAEQFAIYIPVALFQFFGLEYYYQHPSEFHKYSDMQKNSVMLASFAVAISGLVASVLVVIPAVVTLKRVQASLLPEENESIVSFDRTFGGKVQPAVLGGSGVVSMLDAWKTFDWAARFRLLKLYLKITAIQIATSILFILTAVAEVRLINGDYILY